MAFLRCLFFFSVSRSCRSAKGSEVLQKTREVITVLRLFYVSQSTGTGLKKAHYYCGKPPRGSVTPIFFQWSDQNDNFL